MCCGGKSPTNNNYLRKGKTREERIKELQDRHNQSPMSLSHEMVIKKNDNKLRKHSKQN